jgi:NifU-like protein
MTPAEMLDDHVRRPRNLGKLASANTVGDVGSIVIGDALRFYLGMNGERIAQAKFQVFNCQSMLGSTSAITEMAVGKTLPEAMALSSKDVCAHLGGLDYTALPPQLWGLEGLRSAGAALQGVELPFDVVSEPLLCRCFGVTEETVRQGIAVNGWTEVEQVSSVTGAGRGCGSCSVDINRMLKEPHSKPEALSAAPLAAKPEGRIQLLLRIQRLVESKFMPDIRKQGGDLELWDFNGEKIKVKAKGTLLQDEQARIAALTALERLVKEEISPDLVVDPNF